MIPLLPKHYTPEQVKEFFECTDEFTLRYRRRWNEEMQRKYPFPEDRWCLADRSSTEESGEAPQDTKDPKNGRPKR